MDARDTRYSRTLLLAFAAVVMAFILGTLFVNWRAVEIGAQTRAVSTNALPSVEHLSDANDDLRDIEVISASYADLPEDRRVASRVVVDQKWREIDRELGAYLGIPTFEGERELYTDIPAALRAVDEGLRRMFDEAAAGHRDVAHGVADKEVREAIARASAEVRSLIRFNAAHVYESANRIDVLREKASQTALFLDGMAMLVAVGAMLWVGRLYRIHTRLLRDHGELLERRAIELEAFGKRVAHDLLSPLSSLMYCLAAFRKVSETDPALQDAMKRARMCVQRAQSMVDGIFEFARSGGKAEKAAATSVREAVDQMIEELGNADVRERPEIEVEPFAPRWVGCSRGVLMSILSNVMRNAAKYMSDSAVRKITVRLADAGPFVRVEVEDTGPGIAPELREAIFEPYVRAEGATQPGLGLGLATVKRLCLAHGGEVGVRSTLGRGSTFWFTLPKTTEPAALAPPSATIRQIGGAQLR